MVRENKSKKEEKGKGEMDNYFIDKIFLTVCLASKISQHMSKDNIKLATAF